MSAIKGDRTVFESQLKKGKNSIIIIGKVIGNKAPSLITWFYGDQRSEISGVIKDTKGEPVANANLAIMTDEIINFSQNSDINGNYKLKSLYLFHYCTFYPSVKLIFFITFFFFFVYHE